jgi:hypothetical protein
MAIKGAIAKQEVSREILTYFGDRAFLYNDGKEIRVDCMENGVPVQIKIALTAAKEAVERGGDNAVPGAVVAEPRADRIEFGAATAAPSQPVTAPSAEEKEKVAKLLASMASMGL